MNKQLLYFLIILISFFNPITTAAQEPPQIVLQRFNLPNTDYKHCGMSLITYSPEDIKKRHQHTGPEIGYVLDGTITIKLDGHTPEVYRAGDSFQIPVATEHTTEAGPMGAKVLATWVLKN